jgi:hypothetical protein
MRLGTTCFKRAIESDSSWSIFLVVQLRQFQSSVNESYKGLVVLACVLFDLVHVYAC